MKRHVWIKVKLIKECDVPIEVPIELPMNESIANAIKQLQDMPPAERMNSNVNTSWEYKAVDFNPS